jgi:hypothetical protein
MQIIAENPGVCRGLELRNLDAAVKNRPLMASEETRA